METTVRIVVAFIFILIGIFQEIEFKEIYFIIPVFYIFIHFLLKSYIPNIFFIFFDAILTFFVVYFSGNPVNSLIILILFPLYLTNLKHLIVFSVFSSISVIFSFYIIGYIDISLLLLFLGFIFSFFINYRYITTLNKNINEYKLKAINISAKYNKFLKEKNQLYIKKLNRLNIHNPKKLLFDLYSQLNVDGVSLFDIDNSKCIHIGKGSCDKNLLKYVNENIYDFEFGDKIVVVIPVYKKELSKILFLFYKDKVLMEDLSNFEYIKIKLENQLLR